MAKQIPVKPSTRSVQVNGKSMDFHRMNKSWDDLKLANHAGLSAKTIERARKGLPVKMDSLFRIAKALEVEPAVLIHNMEEAIRPSESAAKKPRRIAVFVIDDESSLEDYIASDGVKKLMLTLTYRGFLKDGILDETVSYGSKIILANISQEDYERMSQMRQLTELKYAHGVLYFGAVSDERPLEDQLAEIQKKVVEEKLELARGVEAMRADRKPKRKAT